MSTRVFEGVWREDYETINTDDDDWTELDDWFKGLDRARIRLTIEVLKDPTDAEGSE